MIILFGSASGPKLEAYFAGRQNLGVLMSPLSWRHPWCEHYALDNDVFAHRADPQWWCSEGEKRWLKMLDKVASAERAPLFVLLPDIVADWEGTLKRSFQYRSELLQRGLPIGIALQDGCCFAEAEGLNPAYVFVGGTTAWKWATAEAACQYFQPRGIRVHIGRASGPRRIRECLRIGADSCDGTGWGRFADKMLPGLWRVLDGTDPQLALGL